MFIWRLNDIDIFINNNNNNTITNNKNVMYKFGAQLGLDVPHNFI